MISVDTQLFLYAFNEDAPEHRVAAETLAELGRSDRVALCELVLLEFYLLLRNPAVLARPLTSGDAARVCETWRRHPRWRLVDAAPVMGEVWKRAAAPDFARRRIIDARLALTLRHHGVTTLYTRNVRDFDGFGFDRVVNPFSEQGG